MASEPPNSFYHLSLTDEERTHMERWAWNFWQATGKRMKIPPALYEDLKRAGVSLKYVEPSKALETHGLRNEFGGNITKKGRRGEELP